MLLVAMLVVTLFQVETRQAQAVPVSIYIGPVVTDGFTNTDRGIASATEHLRKAFRRELNCDVSGFCKGDRYRLVGDQSAATVRLYVADRYIASRPGDYSGSIHAGGSIVVGSLSQETIKSIRMIVRLEVGSYRHTYHKGHDSSSKVARWIAKDISAWLTANHERVSQEMSQ